MAGKGAAGRRDTAESGGLVIRTEAAFQVRGMDWAQSARGRAKMTNRMR